MPGWTCLWETHDLWSVVCKRPALLANKRVFGTKLGLLVRKRVYVCGCACHPVYAQLSLLRSPEVRSPGPL